MHNYIIVTNNKKVNDYYEGKKNFELDYIPYEEGIGYVVVLEHARELIHKGGYKLETHPLSGSVKPNETPFKTIVLSETKSKDMDMDGLLIMEDAIATFTKFGKKQDEIYNWPERILEDFSEIDFSLIRGAIERFKY